jgi:hypothetical protein
MFAKVFGCPYQYEPASEVEHKRSAKTEWGWFVGIQWLMALILRPYDLKVISISRRKVHCHESIYARFPLLLELSQKYSVRILYYLGMK